MTESRKRVLLAKPRGYCAGVDRAVQTVEEALKLYGAPIYVRKEIVHNRHVVATLQAKGAIFVEENEEVPEGSTVIFSAHGVAPEVYEQAKQRYTANYAKVVELGKAVRVPDGYPWGPLLHESFAERLRLATGTPAPSLPPGWPDA